jgi:hypothetical protein
MTRTQPDPACSTHEGRAGLMSPAAAANFGD